MFGWSHMHPKLRDRPFAVLPYQALQRSRLELYWEEEYPVRLFRSCMNFWRTRERQFSSQTRRALQMSPSLRAKSTYLGATDRVLDLVLEADLRMKRQDWSDALIAVDRAYRSRLCRDHLEPELAASGIAASKQGHGPRLGQPLAAQSCLQSLTTRLKIQRIATDQVKTIL